MPSSGGRQPVISQLEITSCAPCRSATARWNARPRFSASAAAAATRRTPPRCRRLLGSEYFGSARRRRHSAQRCAALLMHAGSTFLIWQVPSLAAAVRRGCVRHVGWDRHLPYMAGAAAHEPRGVVIADIQRSWWWRSSSARRRGRRRRVSWDGWRVSWR